MISIDPQLIKELIEKGKRLDNRRFDEYREMKIEKGAITTADGSARVRLGSTEVVAGVKFGVGTPFPDSPDEGVLMVSAELLPLASSEFENGPPGEQAIELSRVVDRAIRESKVVDFEKLCIVAKEKVWMAYVDIDVLDDGGNLIDAASIAAIVALLNAKLPKLKEDNTVNYDEKSSDGLAISGVPISTTFVKIAGKILADPSTEEMTALDARLTIGTFEKDGQAYLSSMQKGGTEGLTVEEIDQIIGMAIKRGNDIRKIIA